MAERDPDKIVDAAANPKRNWMRRVVHLARTAKVVKGGRRFAFRGCRRWRWQRQRWYWHGQSPRGA